MKNCPVCEIVYPIYRNKNFKTIGTNFLQYTDTHFLQNSFFQNNLMRSWTPPNIKHFRLEGVLKEYSFLNVINLPCLITE